MDNAYCYYCIYLARPYSGNVGQLITVHGSELTHLALYCRSIIVRRCGTPGASVWFQKLLACVNPGTVSHHPQVQPSQNTSTVPGHPHHHQLNPRQNAASAGKSNPCRRGRPPFYRPHPSSASKYIQCSANGRAFVRTCPSGLRWNQRATTCDRSMPGALHQPRSLP